MDGRDRIDVHSDVMVGKPVIAGTRLSVGFIVGLFGQGWSEEQILHNEPGVTAEDVRACLRYAGEAMRISSQSFAGRAMWRFMPGFSSLLRMAARGARRLAAVRLRVEADADGWAATRDGGMPDRRLSLLQEHINPSA